jgi:hypothetical protein
MSKKNIVFCIGILFVACNQTPQREVMGFAANPYSVTTPASWSTPNWYIDPANVSTCASNANSCTSATCGAGGVGPCLTWEQIASRLGVIGYGANVILQQNTTVDFLSSHTNRSDRVDFTPQIQNPIDGVQVLLTLKAELPAPTCTGTLSSLNVKNRSLTTKSAMLFATSSCFTSKDLYVVNTTRNTAAFTSELNSGSSYYLSQPFSITNFVEDDTWANGDSISVYTLRNIYIGTFGGNSNSPYAGCEILNTSVFAPEGVSDPDQGDAVQLTGNTLVELENSTIQPVLDNRTDLDLVVGTIQGEVNSGSAPTYPNVGLSLFASALHPNNTSVIASGSMNFDTEVLGGNNVFYTGSFDNTFLEGNFFIIGNSSVGVSLYGPGLLTVNSTSRLEYFTTLGTAVAAFHLGGGLRLGNNSAPLGITGCSTTNAQPAITNCGITITPAALDACPASATAFCGLAWSPQGGSYAKGNF